MVWLCASPNPSQDTLSTSGPTHKRTTSGDSNLGGRCLWSPEYKEGSEAHSLLFRPSSRCFPLLQGDSAFSVKSSNKEFKCPLQHKQCSARHPLLDTCKARRGKMREDEGRSGHSGCSHFSVTTSKPDSALQVKPSRRKNWHTGSPRGQPQPLGYVKGSTGTENSCLDNTL